MLSVAKWRGAARMAGFSLGCVCAIALTSFAIVRMLDAAGVAEPHVDLDAMALHLKLIDTAASRNPSLPEIRIAFLADSTAMYFADGARALDHQVGPALDELAPGSLPYRIFSFASPGFTQFTQYFLSHRVANTRPDGVVLAFNLASFSQQWRNADRPELAAWLPMHHLGEALRLPLHWIGLSTDELLLHTAVVELGGFEAWRSLLHEQARCVHAWNYISEWLQARSGIPDGLAYQTLYFFQRRQAAYFPGPPERERPSLAHSRLDAILAGVGPDHPVLRVLRATLEVFREHGIPVLVYIVPLNVEHLERIGLRDRDGLRRGVESVRRVVLASGASLVDLHDLLPDAAFSDGGGHLVVGGSLDAPPIVARRIAQAWLTARDTR